MKHQLLDTPDGSHTLVSAQFGVTYHSKFGAKSESEYVFLASGLDYMAIGATKLRILEAGFGTGLNAFMTWLEAERRRLPIEYLTLELYPLETELAALLNYSETLGAPARAADFLRLHECEWNVPHRFSDYFTFEKRQLAFQAFESESLFDLVYFDAFAPADQPELWTDDVLGRMFRALKPGGTLVTFCSQGAFRRVLKGLGFKVQTLPGIGGKWEITRAVKPEQY